MGIRGKDFPVKNKHNLGDQFLDLFDLKVFVLFLFFLAEFLLF